MKRPARPVDRRLMRDLGEADTTTHVRTDHREQLLANALGVRIVPPKLDNKGHAKGGHYEVWDHGELVAHGPLEAVCAYMLHEYLDRCAMEEVNAIEPNPRVVVVDGRRCIRIQDLGCGSWGLRREQKMGGKGRPYKGGKDEEALVPDIRDVEVPKNAEQALALVAHLASQERRSVKALFRITLLLLDVLGIDDETWLE